MRKYKEEQRPPQSSGEYLHMVRGNEAGVGDFELLVEEGPRKLPPDIWEALKERLSRPPGVQLAINLQITIKVLMREDVRQVMENGLIRDEYKVLDQLHLLSTSAQLAAWELFTIQARQHLIDHMRGVFQEYRTKKGFLPS